MYIMSKARSMYAGSSGSNYGVNKNSPGNGNGKWQGLWPSVGHARNARHINIEAGGNNRNVVFCMNQLGGVGRISNMFATTADGVQDCKNGKLHWSGPYIPSTFNKFLKLVDKNNDGALTVGEVNNYGLDGKEMDTDNDGKVNNYEFAVYRRNLMLTRNLNGPLANFYVVLDAPSEGSFTPFEQLGWMKKDGKSEEDGAGKLLVNCTSEKLDLAPLVPRPDKGYRPWGIEYVWYGFGMLPEGIYIHFNNPSGEILPNEDFFTEVHFQPCDTNKDGIKLKVANATKKRATEFINDFGEDMKPDGFGDNDFYYFWQDIKDDYGQHVYRPLQFLGNKVVEVSFY